MSLTQQRTKPSNIQEPDLQVKKARKTPDQLLNELQENRLALVAVYPFQLKCKSSVEKKPVIVTNLQVSFFSFFFFTSLTTLEDTIVPLAWAGYVSPAED